MKDEIKMPRESYGICKTVKCRTSNLTAFIDLANGVCQVCWDNGLGGQRTYRTSRSSKAKRKSI